jgi:CRP/FNR family cyclic AMP-dependent transcriptional regulator
METKTIDLFKGIPLFGGLDEKALGLLMERGPFVSVPRGRFFFREGEAADSLFILQSGRIAILKAWHNHEYVLRRLEPRECFGEMALMDLGPRSASVLALEDSHALELSTGTLDELYRRSPEQYMLLEMNMGREVSRRLRESNEQLFRARVEVKVVDGEFHFYTV